MKLQVGVLGSDNSLCVGRAPWSADNRQHGQQTGAFFSWRPVPRPFQEDLPIPARCCPEQSTWTAVRLGHISGSPHTREMLWHCPTCEQSPWPCPACVPPTTSIPAPTQPNIPMTNYTYASTVTNSSIFQA